MVWVYSNPVPGAVKYTIELNTDPAFGSGTAITLSGNSRALNFSGLAQSKTYYTRVMTDVDPGVWGNTNTNFITAGPLGRSNEDWVGDVSEITIEQQPLRILVDGNPFSERLRFIIETMDAIDAEVTLFDLMGKPVHESVEKTNTPIVIQKPMANGVYLLRVSAGNATGMVKVMKMD